MSLPEAIAYAHEHQPDLKAALARVEAVRSESAVARARWYPTVTGTAQLLATTTNNTTGSYVGVPLFDNPRISATRADSTDHVSLQPEPSTLLGVGVRQEVYDFGRISAEAAAADLRADAERLSSDARRLAVDYDVEETFFAVHAAKAVRTASQKAFERAAVHRDEAKGGVEAGMRRPIELTRAEAVLDRYELERIRAQRSVTVAEAIFAAAVGVPDRLLDVAGDAPGQPDLPSLDDALSSALRRNPEVRAASTRIHAQEHTTTAIEAETRPNLSLTGALSGNSGGSTPTSGEVGPAHGLLPLVPNWDVGVVLTWPLVDATVRARADQSRAYENVRREEAESLETKLTSQLEASYADATAARDALPVLRHTLEAATANYEQASGRFEAGMSNAVELADAEELRTRAEIDLALGVFELARARASLARLLAEGAS